MEKHERREGYDTDKPDAAATVTEHCMDIRIAGLDVKDPATAREICALEREAYGVEARLIGFDGIPPLSDTPEALAESREVFCGCYAGGELAGLISFTLDGGTLDICRVAVHPRFFRRGVASGLLRFAESREGVSRIIVSTGRDNAPAVSLYLKHGFRTVGDREVAGGLTVTDFEKRLPLQP